MSHTKTKNESGIISAASITECVAIPPQSSYLYRNEVSYSGCSIVDPGMS